MTTLRSPKKTPSMPIIAATTAALPAVMLSSLAIAQPASALPAPQPQRIPATLAAAMEAQASVAANVIPASAVAASIPTSVQPMAPGVPDTYTIVRGDTVSAIAARYGLDTDTVLQLNGLTATTIIYPGQQIKLSGSGTIAPASITPAAATPAAGPSSGSYTVVSGDTLSAIAARNGVALSDVFAWNGLDGRSIIYPGQQIKLSGGNGGVTLAPASVPSAPAAPAPSAPAPAGPGAYTIKVGDTLGGIASRLGVSLSSLLSANHLSMSTIIYPGQKLAVPGASGPAQAPAPAAAPLVPSTFLGYTYPAAVVSSANANKALLNAAPVPSTTQMKGIVADTARRMGVDPSLAMAFAYQESGFNQRAVSPANAIGTMQVIPSSGEWASDLVGRKLNLLDPYDNVTAGVAIIRALVSTSKDEDNAIAGYYQGQYSVQKHGMYDDTKAYVASIKALQKKFS
ncbi:MULTISPECIES: LysM peptidoglycan-binding domain-containing protein [Arthrobacter]|uniref:LysM peptidoglycan-binding domain-containing protein n=1 Tax=Arthrobacter terricola TaxID=2547396 RepID=A0A4R5K8U3_9MICC|nr:MULTISPECIES: LysM peptidoglycan-binding domain-containing protein [Arthrobacter]MBT8159347.1 LysM peptidoglycan-binding domain-containing protein [Arthrobacter sp. GN70]TDF91376.1 LysM peptidoglycan-binding domain-containing protein [Arthrobacter terricola]